MLRGTAVMKVNGMPKLIEAPEILPITSMKTNDMTFEVDFSTDAKFMCHRFALEGDAFASFETNDKRVSLAALEIKRSSFFSNRQDINEFVKSELSLPSRTTASGSKSRRSRYSLQLTRDTSTTHNAKHVNQNRRSTIDVGLMFTSETSKKKGVVENLIEEAARGASE